MIFPLVCLVIVSGLTGFLIGDYLRWQKLRSIVLAKDAELEVTQDAENYNKYCEQTKWRLKLAGTIEVIENDKVEVL